MKKLIFIFLSFIIAISTANAQKGINFSRNYSAGGKLLMCVDSSAKNIYYGNVFPNQPNTFFNYLPDVKNVSIQIFFRKNIKIQNYRYTILENNKPVAVNKSIDIAQLKETDAGGEEIFSSTTLGIFSLKDKVIKILLYSIERPQDIDQSVFYGKLIPRAKIKSFAKRFAVDHGVSYSYITAQKESTSLTFTKKDDELTIVKDKSDIDYLYYASIKDKQTNKIIFESSAWQYGSYIDEAHEFSPYIKIDKNIFKKSGNYEIIIQPSINWKIPQKDIEKYITRHALSITLDQESYTQKELFIYGFIAVFSLGLIFLVILYFIKRRNRKMLEKKEQKKNITKLHLNSVRSQLNPHFLFNALAGIQNLMNKNEIDNANRYLSKFARLTRNVLDSKELISLTEEKTLLDDYLQMEQLRFGFQYKLSASAELDTENIEIPAMLLQPFVENAVKHGIAEKGNEGKIEIAFEKHLSNLVLKISDNGKGFNTTQTYNGLGLELSKNRISLLNTIYKETPFTLDINSNENGTHITITLTQWI